MKMKRLIAGLMLLAGVVVAVNFVVDVLYALIDPRLRGS